MCSAWDVTSICVHDGSPCMYQLDMGGCWPVIGVYGRPGHQDSGQIEAVSRLGVLTRRVAELEAQVAVYKAADHAGESPDVAVQPGQWILDAAATPQQQNLSSLARRCPDVYTSSGSLMRMEFRSSHCVPFCLLHTPHVITLVSSQLLTSLIFSCMLSACRNLMTCIIVLHVGVDQLGIIVPVST